MVRKLAWLFSIFFGLTIAGQAGATPLIDFTNDGSSFIWYGNDAGCSAGCTLGYSFTVANSVTIDGLGVYDHQSDGLDNTHEVALWTSGGSLLVQTSVGPGAAT